ncbi:MAG TPA: dynamin family protein, partial [Streptosporangiaceae bacterium]|nr:dynamin family protein [Streptosporangiaceae bacterium]
MSSFESHRRELLALLRPAIDIAYSRGAIESAQRLGDATNRLKEGRLVTVVCGEFKRGKSTLLGALLDDPGLFPADVDIATNMVTSVGYGAAEMIEVVLAVAGAEQALTIDRDGIPQYVTEQGNPGNTRDVRLLTIKTPNQKLASGLTFFDTPGVGGLNQEHTAVTYGFLPAADAVVFVSDVTTPLSESELDFVRRISEYCPLILFVITKTDLRDDYADIVRNTRDKLAEVSGRPADDLLIIPVSSAAKLAYLRGGDGDDLELSNFPALEQTLREVLERRRGQILITRAATGFMRASEALALPIRTELQAARASASADLASLSADLETKERRIAELQQNGASWRQDLRKYIQELRYEIRRQLNYGLNRIWQRVPTTYLEDDRMLAQPTLIISALEADVGLLLGSLAERAT